MVQNKSHLAFTLGWHFLVGPRGYSIFSLSFIVSLISPHLCQSAIGSLLDQSKVTIKYIAIPRLHHCCTKQLTLPYLAVLSRLCGLCGLLFNHHSHYIYHYSFPAATFFVTHNTSLRFRAFLLGPFLKTLLLLPRIPVQLLGYTANPILIPSALLHHVREWISRSRDGHVVARA